MSAGVGRRVVGVMAVGGFFARWCKGLIASVISLAVFSLMMALEFSLLQAPDVAIAEAAIGAGLSTTIFIITIRACRRPKSREGGKEW